MNTIHGPILSSSDIDFHIRMFEAVFDMRSGPIEELSPDTVRKVWGLAGHSAKAVTMQTPQTEFGVRILEFSPSANSTIRHRSKGMIPGAAKVIDFFVEDLDDALARARQFGLVINDDIAAYETAEGRVREAHAWVLDEIVCAMIESPQEMTEKFTADIGRRVSEPQSISGPTTSQAEAIEFFEDVLGFKTVYEYEVNDSNFGDMLGSDTPVNISAKNVGTDLKKPYIGLIKYHSAKPADSEAIPRVEVPVRGLLGITVITDEAERVYERSAAWPEAMNGPIRSAAFEPWGACSSFLLNAPNGMLIHVIEPH